MEIDQFNDWDYNKSKNAYILFYEKVDFQFANLEPTFREKQLVKNVWQENHVFLRNILFYSSDYLCFVKDFICQFKFPEQLEVKKEVISYSSRMLLETGLADDPESLIQLEKTPALKVNKLMTLSSY